MDEYLIKKVNDIISKLNTIKQWFVSESLAVQMPNGRVFQLTLIFLVGYFILGEIIFRTDTVQAELTGPRIGSRHRQFENQIARLEKLEDEGRHIDCIFLGNSMVWLGVNPLVVNQSFFDETGQKIQCFNFGVSALPASSAGQIAPVLVEMYHPKVLIYGTFARDYALPMDVEDAYVITETPWLKYKNGEFNLPGWLYAHSKLFQYKDHIHDFLFIKYLEDVFSSHDMPPYQAFGLDPKFDIRIDVNLPPNYEDIGNKEMSKWLRSYKIYEENLAGLQQIVNQSDHGVRVIVVEMPFHETAYEFFSNGKQDYETYIQEMDAITASTSTPFWRADEQLFLPPENWWDYFHLNLQGANIFSEWLGKKLSESYLQGDLELIPLDIQ
jgi:hypothetical protein